MSEILSRLSDDLSETVNVAGKSVVRVEGRRRLPASGIVWSADGVVVTAHHILERDDNLKLGLPDGETVAAELAGRDPTTDIAVLRAQGAKLAPPGWTEPDDVRVGNLVLAVGRPGRTAQATLGIVSALGKSWRTSAGGQVDRYMQSDVAMYPGFSGGPLVDSSGHVIGLNTSALLRGLNVVLPVPTLRNVVDTLLAHGRVRRGYLGVSAQVARLPEALEPKQEQETGLLVVSVEPESPSDRGGMLMGDTILSLDGKRVRHLDDLLAHLSVDLVGATVPVQIVRGGKIQELKVTVSERG